MMRPIDEGGAARSAMRSLGIPVEHSKSVGALDLGKHAYIRHIEGMADTLAKEPWTTISQNYTDQANRAGTSDFDPYAMTSAAKDLLVRTRQLHPWLNMFNRVAEQHAAKQKPVEEPVIPPTEKVNPSDDTELENQADTEIAPESPTERKPRKSPVRINAKNRHLVFPFLTGLVSDGLNESGAVDQLVKRFGMTPRTAKKWWMAHQQSEPQERLQRQYQRSVNTILRTRYGY